ncbi:MAG: sulfoxide reductase catalytic subunit YedY, partial [Candidatus Azotimanducaceae bacterium]
MKKPWTIPESEVTDQKVYLNRRQFMRGVGTASIAGLVPAAFAAETGGTGLVQAEQPGPHTDQAPQWLQRKVRGSRPASNPGNEALTPYEYATRYNNFYEFGTAKDDPYENAQDFKTDPWQLTISGEAELTGSFQLEDILKPHDLEERIYRLRCVEAWSMVIPWIGFPLADLIKRFKPTSRAKYVRFQTLYDPSQMPGQASRFAA